MPIILMAFSANQDKRKEKGKKTEGKKCAKVKLIISIRRAEKQRDMREGDSEKKTRKEKSRLMEPD